MSDESPLTWGRRNLRQQPDKVRFDCCVALAARRFQPWRLVILIVPRRPLEINRAFSNVPAMIVTVGRRTPSMMARN